MPMYKYTYIYTYMYNIEYMYTFIKLIKIYKIRLVSLQ
jgi:hypothetical protein